MKAFVQLSKAGDILSILPILQKEFAREGVKIPLIVAKEYAPMLEGVSFVEPVIWKGQATDLGGAVLFAKKHFSQVVVLQTHGNMPVQRSLPSFQLDQWRRAGVVDYFEDWPLTFDNRSPERESVLIQKHGFLSDDIRPVILFGDHSQSSPFFQKEELYAMLKKEFGDYCRIIRLSEVKGERIYDLLGLFDLAACLVTVETAHIHLSRASKVPTVVLAANGWRGAAFQSKFKFFMRYVEWDARKADLIEAVRAVVFGGGQTVTSKPVSTGRHGYNLSLIQHGKEYVYTYRIHTEGNWKTKLFLNGAQLYLPERYKNFSAEDCRLFVFNGKLHGAYVVSTAIDGQFRCYMAYGEIVGNQIEHIQIGQRDNNLSGMTKNLVPFVHASKLHFIHGIKGGNQIVLQMDRDKVSSEYKSAAPSWSWGEIRGGYVIEHEGNFLRFFHSRLDYGDKSIRYFVGASIIEAKPPFKTIAVSKKPILVGDEKYTNCPHWKGNVVFPLGAAKENGKILISYGANDCECRLAELTEADLNL